MDRSRKVGAGLGLAIVREMTEAHGGHVEVVPPSDPACGAVFELIIPIEPDEHGERGEADEPSESGEPVHSGDVGTFHDAGGTGRPRGGGMTEGSQGE